MLGPRSDWRWCGWLSNSAGTVQPVLPGHQGGCKMLTQNTRRWFWGGTLPTFAVVVDLSPGASRLAIFASQTGLDHLGGDIADSAAYLYYGASYCFFSMLAVHSYRVGAGG